MRGELFSRVHEEVSSPEALALQNSHLLRARLGAPVIAAAGSTVAHQGRVTFEPTPSASQGRLLRRGAGAEESPLMTVSGQGDVFLAHAERHVFLVDLEGPQDALSIRGASLLAFESSLDHEVRWLRGTGVPGSFDTLVGGHGRVALTCHGTPLILDCSRQPTFVGAEAAVCWSAGLQPVVQGLQYAFHGPGFVVLQPSRGAASGSAHGSGGSGGFLGDVFGG